MSTSKLNVFLKNFKPNDKLLIGYDDVEIVIIMLIVIKNAIQFQEILYRNNSKKYIHLSKAFHSYAMSTDVLYVVMYNLSINEIMSIKNTCEIYPISDDSIITASIFSEYYKTTKIKKLLKFKTIKF